MWLQRCLHFSVRGDITVTEAPETQVAFKNCVPFNKCITKLDETTIDDVLRFRFSNVNVQSDRI